MRHACILILLIVLLTTSSCTAPRGAAPEAAAGAADSDTHSRQGAPPTVTATPTGLTDQERADLVERATEVWNLCLAGDAAAVQRLLAHNPAPELYAQGYGQGLDAVLAWARTQGRRATIRAITVANRKSYSVWDGVNIETDAGRFSVLFSITDRSVVKILIGSGEGE